MQVRTYQQSGVDLDRAQALIRAIAPLASQTYNESVLQGVGGFFGAYAMPSGYKEPVLISCTDGVGTKLKLAKEARQLYNLGLDLVAMNVNDLICAFAKPLFFLDYFATSKLEPSQTLALIEGMAKGCKEAGCALIGGESAQMPGVYAPREFDLAGFCVGVAEKSDLNKKDNIQAGDILVGFKSSGLHSNGFSLVREILKSKPKSASSLDTLLTPTKLYTPLLALKDKIHALAHITGGGLRGNLERVLPPTLSAQIELKALPDMPVFSWLKEHLELAECLKVFNMGVGMVAIAPCENLKVLEKAGGFYLGTLKSGAQEIIFLE
ncbi:phosphoribosylformylglycinamidine cyclo-ligase [Helicobacter sp. NHP22-001]|uniref:phosphoribosylformylglycinamidine cyclo-ligase n=1 Tax=Helicobacter sp. NHP22-001 TaxID=3040202 RepID=UPI00244D8B48|nr:phosphoribosylformylglycinamidine cyclo-ligase [Helicobacter sp. NHP22-001]GMB96342.1 phosphoribosylformylglycinamidine cyclo-ligase [Helicobacter sp. NHP22-001]